MKEFHPVANIFPLINGDEFNTLKDDIEANGLIEPIWLHSDGSIIDGRNRYRACVDIGIEPEYRTYTGDDNSLVSFVISLNLTRRHLSSSQKAVVALEIEKYLAELAVEQLREAGRKAAMSQHHEEWVFQKIEKPIRAAQQAAELTGTNRQYVNDAKRISEEAPEVLEFVTSGAVNIPDAKRLSKQPEENRKRIINRVKETNGGKKPNIKKFIRETDREMRAEAVETVDVPWLLVGDFRIVGSQIPDNSVDLIFTDPPYDKAAAKLYGDLAQFASRVLKPGGVCLAYSGQMHLPQIYPAMGQHLEYMWTCGIGHSDGATWFRKWNLLNQWKPLLMYGKPPLAAFWRRFYDFASGGKEKSDHEWQQSLSEAVHYISALCPPGGMVVDPFLGSGTTLVAAKELGLQYCGVEVDQHTAKIAQGKVSDYAS